MESGAGFIKELQRAFEFIPVVGSTVTVGPAGSKLLLSSRMRSARFPHGPSCGLEIIGASRGHLNSCSITDFHHSRICFVSSVARRSGLVGTKVK